MATSPPLNVLLIFTDQFRWDCLGCLGHPVVRTPNLDRLAAGGVLFRSAYTPTAPCAPARASLFTGRYPAAHGLCYGQHHLRPADATVLPQRLRDAGYDTALVGKLHLKPMHRDYGFVHQFRNDSFYANYDPDEPADSAYVAWLRATLGGAEAQRLVARFTEDESAHDRDQVRFLLGTNVVDEAHHVTPWTARETIRLFGELARPFFLNASFIGPHQPYLCPGRWATLFDPETLPLPEAFDAAAEDKPVFAANAFLQGFLRKREAEGWTEATYRKALAAYYGNIAMIDHAVGTMLDGLRDAGLEDSTLVVFTTDHGDYAGQFRSFFKSLPYEGTAHVPLIVRDPRSARRGETEDRHVNTLDLFATFHRLAGLEVPPSAESRDLLPLLRDADASWDNATFHTQGDNAALVRDGWKLIRGEAKGRTVYELYDLAERPVEAVNRADDPSCAARLAAMRAELDPWMARQEEVDRAREERCASESS